jgi:hypothetical protein
MNAMPASRVNYFDRQYLRLAEMTDEQAYHLQLRRRHNLSHHGWGIVTGLDVALGSDKQPAVAPGLAVDGYGRELLVVDRAVFGRDVFDRLGTNRIDLWLEYGLALSAAPSTAADASSTEPRAAYRATEVAAIVPMPAKAAPDPTHPQSVPSLALEPPLLDTPDDPTKKWPVYLGRIVMDLTTPATPTFTIDTSDRVYVGLNAELIDHPGNATRMELGRRPTHDDTRAIGADTITYAGDATRDFGLFVPKTGTDPLQPTLAVSQTATTIRGDTEIHGNLVLDGASLQFPDPLTGAPPDTSGNPAIYRFSDSTGDELRIDVGSADTATRSCVIGLTKDGKFVPALVVAFTTISGAVTANVTITGNLEVDGTINSPDIRTRTVTPDVAAMLTGMIQAAITSP